MTALCIAPTVAIVGGGASGTLTGAHLARAAAQAGQALEIVLIEPGRPGRGVAYSTKDPRHKLNVPACGMSAWPDEPAHFVRWLREHVAPTYPDTGFAARSDYGDYLEDVLTAAVAASRSVRLDHVRSRAIDVTPHGGRQLISLTDDTVRAADAVVLALGHGAPSVAWAPEALRRAPGFVPDPWQPGTTAGSDDATEILVVGAGLTAVDMAMRWWSPGRRIHVVSRHGMLPLPHHPDHVPARGPGCDESGPSATDVPSDLAAARRMVFAAIRAADGDWRRAVDDLRPVTARLWQALGESDQRRFLAVAARRWDRVRHRIDPLAHAWLDRRRAEGSLVLHAGGVRAAFADGDRTIVALGDGSRVPADVVLNCTGPSAAVTSSTDPLVMNLLASGAATPGPLNLGFTTDQHGRLHSPRSPGAALWTLGPLRRGQLWESTAVPEIRVQAGELVRELLAALPQAQPRRRAPDRSAALFGAAG